MTCQEITSEDRPLMGSQKAAIVLGIYAADFIRLAKNVGMEPRWHRKTTHGTLARLWDIGQVEALRESKAYQKLVQAQIANTRQSHAGFAAAYQGEPELAASHAADAMARLLAAADSSERRRYTAMKVELTPLLVSAGLATVTAHDVGGGMVLAIKVQGGDAEYVWFAPIRCCPELTDLVTSNDGSIPKERLSSVRFKPYRRREAVLLVEWVITELRTARHGSTACSRGGAK